jgi:hypothetical protein
MERKKTTVYIDSDLLAAVRVLSASAGKRDYEVMEEALRLYLSRPQIAADREQLRELFDRIAASSDLTEDEALAVAYQEVKQRRQSRRAAHVKA